MKHHVFFFLLTIFFPVCAMDKYEEKFSQLIERCVLVNQYCPCTYDIKQLEESKKELLLLSPTQKKLIFKQAREYVPRNIKKADGHVVFSWKSNENKSTDNRICST